MNLTNFDKNQQNLSNSGYTIVTDRTSMLLVLNQFKTEVNPYSSHTHTHTKLDRKRKNKRLGS